MNAFFCCLENILRFFKDFNFLSKKKKEETNEKCGENFHFEEPRKQNLICFCMGNILVKLFTIDLDFVKFLLSCKISF